MLKNSLKYLLSSTCSLTAPSNVRLQSLVFKRFLTATVENEKFIVVQENTGNAKSEPLKFPGVWLRDNCCCTQCFHPTSKSRKHDWDKFDVKVKVNQIKVSSKSQILLAVHIALITK